MKKSSKEKFSPEIPEKKLVNKMDLKEKSGNFRILVKQQMIDNPTLRTNFNFSQIFIFLIKIFYY